MKKESMNQLSLDDHLGCLGNFNNQDPICRKVCALSLRCAIDSDRNTQMEFLEDLITYSDMFIKIQ
jgi:hypothetical protein